jgi:hypothetical protein
MCPGVGWFRGGRGEVTEDARLGCQQWSGQVIYYSRLRLRTLQMHYTENSKQIFPEIKLRGLVPNFYIHVSVSNLYIPTIGPQMQYSKIGRPIVAIYKSLTDTLM